MLFCKEARQADVRRLILLSWCCNIGRCENTTGSSNTEIEP